MIIIKLNIFQNNDIFTYRYHWVKIVVTTSNVNFGVIIFKKNFEKSEKNLFSRDNRDETIYISANLNVKAARPFDLLISKFEKQLKKTFLTSVTFCNRLIATMSTIYRSNFYDVDSIGNFSAGDHTQLGVKLSIKT